MYSMWIQIKQSDGTNGWTINRGAIVGFNHSTREVLLFGRSITLSVDQFATLVAELEKEETHLTQAAPQERQSV